MRSWILLPSLLGALGCGSAVTPASTHHSDVPDATVTMSTTDTDGDGLCDPTEMQRGTDPHNADTDGDGLLDSLEVQLGTDPLSAADPPQADRLPLPETPGSMTLFDQFLGYEGTVGEVVNGAIQDRGTATDGRAALGVAGFHVTAVDADPAAFIEGVNGAEFVGVTGYTTLHWRVTVQPLPSAGILGCRRAYGYTFIVRQAAGIVVEVHDMVLDETAEGIPDGGAPSNDGPDGGGPWPRVSPTGLCLPAPPCQ